MKKYLKNYASILLLALFFTVGLFSVASASITPVLSLSNLSNGYVQITVTADPNASVVLYYYTYSPASALSVGLGNTASNGYFSTTVANGQYNIPTGAYVYVMVNGISSPVLSWPIGGNYYGGGYNNGSVTFSQNNISLTTNQNTSVTLYGGSGYYYISSGVTSSVSANVSGSVLNIYGNQAGIATITVCSSGSSCGSLYVTVTNPYQASNYYPNYYTNYYPTPVQAVVSVSPIYLSQNSLGAVVGQNQAISIYGSGSYYIYSNSNPYFASATINGSLLSVYAISPGSTNMTICQNSGGYCANLYVTVTANIIQYYYPQQTAMAYYPAQQYSTSVRWPKFFSYLYPPNWSHF